MSKIVITGLNDLILLIEYENGEPIRVNCSKTSAVTIGDIYVGRVSKIKHDLNAAFVDFKENLTGFLPLNQCDHSLKQGDLISVMITGEPVKTKGYKLSAYLEMAGDYLVFSTKDRCIGASSKLDSAVAGELVGKITEDFDNLNFGLIVRTKATVDNYPALKEELVKKGSAFDEILKYGNTRSLYSCLYKERPSYIKLLSELDQDSFDEIVCENKEIYEELITFYPDKARLFDDSRISFKALYRIEHTLDLLTSKKVNLPCGGYIIIEPTEALTTIDVNSGKIDSYKDKNKMINKVNKEAAKEIAKQLMLRNISGMIVVDFINYLDKDFEDELVLYLKNQVKFDKCKTKVYGFTNLKLLEMTRQKLNASVYDYLKYYE